MIHHLVLCKLAPEADEARIEWLMRQAKSNLLKIPEVLSVRCGRNLDASSEWGFFFATDFHSTDQMAAYAEHPVHLKFVENVILPYTTDRLILDYEMEPGKNLLYS